MRAVTAAELLNVWERGMDGSAVQRALLLLAAVYPDTPVEELAALTIGQRDACLLLLRERLFGSRLTSVAACPVCGESLDLDFQVRDLCSFPLPEIARRLEIQIDGYDVQFRLPNSLDLAAISGYEDVDQATGTVLKRCIETVQYGDQLCSVEELSDTTVTAIADAMAKADPYADIELEIACPNCGHRWMSGFDIVTYLWKELQVWARRTLRDVHVLASAYGWNEAEALALSPRRRQMYIDMVLG